MAEAGGVEYTVTCPHCGGDFAAEPMTSDTGQPGGFKCPHCRLFVSYDRADELELLEPTE
jgi:hypothetical protein